MAIDLAEANLTADQRDKMKSVSLKGSGAYPIPNVLYLRKAVMAFGRCRPDDRAALVAHIKARAAALGADKLPWLVNFLKAHSPASTSK